jgi:hypothetical protein
LIMLCCVSNNGEFNGVVFGNVFCTITVCNERRINRAILMMLII